MVIEGDDETRTISASVVNESYLTVRNNDYSFGEYAMQMAEFIKRKYKESYTELQLKQIADELHRIWFYEGDYDKSWCIVHGIRKDDMERMKMVAENFGYPFTEATIVGEHTYEIEGKEFKVLTKEEMKDNQANTVEFSNDTYFAIPM